MALTQGLRPGFTLAALRGSVDPPRFLQPGRSLLWLKRRTLIRRFLRSSEVSQREFQAAIFGVIVIVEAERDVESIAREQTSLLTTLRHVPTQGIEGDSFAPLAVRLLPV